MTVGREGERYRLVGDCSVDVELFLREVADGRGALAAGDAARAVELIGAALARWDGAPFEGAPAVPGLTGVGASLGNTRADALADLAAAQLRCRLLTEAVSTAGTLLAAEHLDERGWAALATGHYLQGRQDVALGTLRRARQTLLDELGVDPTPALVELERRILRHDLTVPEQAGASPVEPQDAGLPALPEPFVGRDRLVDDVVRDLESGRSPVALVGLGGVGKTAAATAVARRLVTEGRSVRWFDARSHLDTRAALIALCEAVGVEPAGDPVVSLAGTKVDALVVDATERLAGIGDELARLTTLRPDLLILVTSRRPTAAAASRTVPGLALADEDGPGAAARLFHARSRARWTDRPDDVQRLCRWLDGIPLALEIAAARTAVVPPGMLHTRLAGRRTSLLDAEPPLAERDDPGRQSLGAVLAEAEEGMSPAGRHCLGLLGAVDGWMSVELLEAASEGLVDGDLVESLSDVVDHGLAHTHDGRLRLVTPALEHARRAPGHERYAVRVAQAVGDLAGSSAPDLLGADAAAAVARLARDEAVVLTALARTSDPEAVWTLFRDSSRYWLLTGRLYEGHDLAVRVAAIPGLDARSAAGAAVLRGTFASYVNAPGADDVLVAALDAARRADLPPDRLVVNGWCCLAAGRAQRHELDGARSAAAEAAALAARSGHEELTALARDVRGLVASYEGDHEAALEAYWDGLEDARRGGDEQTIMNLLVGIADVLCRLDRLTEARDVVDEAAARLTGSTEQDGPIAPHVLLNRGIVTALQGHHDEARDDLLATLRGLRDRPQSPVMVGDALTGLGGVAAWTGDDPAAARLFGAATRLYDDAGSGSEERMAVPFGRARTDVVERLGERRFRTLAALGSADPDGTVDVLLGGRVRV